MVSFSRLLTTALVAFLLACPAATNVANTKGESALSRVKFRAGGKWVTASELDGTARRHLADRGVPVPEGLSPVFDLFNGAAFIRISYPTTIAAPLWDVAFDKSGKIIAHGKSVPKG